MGLTLPVLSGEVGGGGGWHERGVAYPPCPVKGGMSDFLHSKAYRISVSFLGREKKMGMCCVHMCCVYACVCYACMGMYVCCVCML